MTTIPPRQLTPKQAEAARTAVIRHFRAWTHDAGGTPRPDSELPELREPLRVRVS